MPRIPDALIERIKKEVLLERLAADAGVALKRRGKDWVAHCPFHQEKTPSFIITPSKNLFHCMGCGAAGSPIDWVMRVDGLDFRKAAEKLAKAHFPGSFLAHSRAAKEEPLEPLKNKLLDVHSGPAFLMKEVIRFYHRTAKATKAYWAYLTKRGLNNPAMVDHFQLGYVDRTLSSVMPSPDSKQGSQVRARLRELGVTRESGHEHFYGCLIVPVFNRQGQVSEVYGRKVAKQRKDSPEHLYLPGPHRGVWNWQGLQGQNEVILCEALLDALTFWHHGFQHVTSSYGVRGFTNEHLELFKEFGIQKVFIAFDQDKPGDEAAQKLAEQLAEHGIESYRVRFPKGMDANTFAQKVTPATKSFAVLLEKAPLMVEVPNKKEPPGLTQSMQMRLNQEPTQHPPPKKIELPKLPNPFEIEEEGENIYARRGDRTYRIRGLASNTNANVMKVNIYAHHGESVYVDTLNLYSGYHRSHFAKQVSRELGINQTLIEKDLGRLLLELEHLQAEHFGAKSDKKVELSEAEVKEAVDYLRDPCLLERILEDFEACGMIGEETTKLVGYLVATSRKLDQPLGAIIQSASASGKSTAMDAVLAFIPDEDKVKYSAITGQSLYYMGEEDLQRKVLALVEEAGAEKASYPLKLLLSEGELTIASTGKNDQTGQHATQAYKVKGPVAVMLTTTAVDTDEEFQNRCLVLAVDETRHQTRAIHQLQRRRRTLNGLLTKHGQDHVVQRQQNVQRLLRPLHVVNPFAENLTFLDTQTRMRRDHQKYLNLIDCLAFLHQYQRPVKTVLVGDEEITYVEASPKDVAIANHLAAEVLGRTLDELAPQTRALLLQLCDLVNHLVKEQSMHKDEIRFTRRQVREFTGWSEFQVRTHLERLQRMEYVLVHRGMRGQSYVYELLYDGEGEQGQPFLMGLLEPEKLQTTAHVTKFEHSKEKFEGSTSPQRGANEPPLRSVQSLLKAKPGKGLEQESGKGA